jgi:hypothetical protein
MQANELLNPRPTREDMRAGLQIMMAVAETIREAGEVPSGVLYAGLIGRIDIHGYTKLIGILKNSGLVEEQAHLLRWIGPALEVAK